MISRERALEYARARGEGRRRVPDGAQDRAGRVLRQRTRPEPGGNSRLGSGPDRLDSWLGERFVRGNFRRVVDSAPGAGLIVGVSQLSGTKVETWTF